VTAKVEIGACTRPLRVSTHKSYTRPDGTTCCTHDQLIVPAGETHTFHPYTGEDSSYAIIGIEELSIDEAAKLRSVDDMVDMLSD